MDEFYESLDILIEKYEEDLVLCLSMDYYEMPYEDVYNLDLNKKMKREFKKLIVPKIEEYGSEFIFSELMKHLLLDDTDNEPGVPEIKKMRVFNLPKKIFCFDCQVEYNTSELLQQAISFHFNYFEELGNCDDCEFGIPELHYIDIRCYNCNLQWNFELKNTDKTDERKSWFVKLDSYESNNLENKYSEEMYDTKQREFTVTIDINKKPELETIEAMLDDSVIRSEILISCDESMHFYLVDLGNKRILDSGPIYCPGCDSFHSEMGINRRSMTYQNSKDICYHDYLDLCQGDDPIILDCPRCDYYG